MACEDVLSPVADALLQCVVTVLADCGEPVGAHFLAAGNPSADFCCSDDRSNGMAWVSIVSIVPIASPGNARCQGPMTATFRVGVARCVHTLTDDGDFPAPADLDADGLLLFADASRVREAIVCCWPGTPIERYPRGISNDAWALVSWTAIESQGACAGGYWTVTYDFSFCNCA